MKFKKLVLFNSLIAFIGSFAVIEVAFSSNQLIFSEIKDSTMFHFTDSLVISEIETFDWQILLEEMAENGMETEEWEEKLTELANHPINLNDANKEILESIPILNADQIESLSYYLYRYGPIVSLSEILLVEGMDARTMRWLKPFVRIGRKEESRVVYPEMKKALVYGRQEVRWSMGANLQQKKGYFVQSDSLDHYLGDPIHATFRYGFNFKNQLQWGIVLEKDAGESWWNSSKNGIDFVSLHLLVKDSKRMNTLILGDFKVRFGQGLVCGNAFSLGKNTAGGAPELTGSSLSRHFSTSEINFFRGAAMRLNLKPGLHEKAQRLGLNLTTFISSRKLDSSVENGIFKSISKTGLHRNRGETEIQNSLKQSVIGGHFQIKWTNLQMGITALGWIFNASATEDLESWKAFSIKGNKGGNISCDFRTVWRGMLAYGEFAIDPNGNKAMLTGVTFKPHSRMNVSMLGRKYTPRYLALFSNSFAEGTSTQNEDGLYASTDFQLAKRIRFSGYLDVFRFPWMSYNISAPSWGQEVATEWNATFGRNGLVKLLIKSKTKEKNLSISGLPINPVLPWVKNQTRLQISQKVQLCTVKTQLYVNEFKTWKQNHRGYALAQDLGFETPGKRLSVSLHAVLFNTESWENRMYLWEKDLPGSFSMPMLYGQGFRFALFLKYNLKHLSFQFKIADCVQPGLETIGDGLERINGNRRTEARFQLSWIF